MDKSIENLTKQSCNSIPDNAFPLNHAEIMQYEEIVPEWILIEDKEIAREFKFDNFQKAIDFINEVAEISESENHHPDILLHGWNKITINLSTHKIKGLSENDFILAAKINELVD